MSKGNKGPERYDCVGDFYVTRARAKKGDKWFYISFNGKRID